MREDSHLILEPGEISGQPNEADSDGDAVGGGSEIDYVPRIRDVDVV